ncbi:MAG: hypothetical protein Q7K26_04060 [bacterium]|nr:hypothetical protein [bacterium]
MAIQEKQFWKNQAGIWGVGYTANFLLVKGFYLLLYPTVIWYFGLFDGAGIMWCLSLLVCYLTILFYDWCKIDWLGIEALKEVGEGREGKGLFHRIIGWIFSRGELVVFLFISVKWNPFICFAFMRHGAHQYNGMTRRDWQIFIASVVVSNTWWTTIVFTGLTLVESVIRAVKSAL